ncbi:hypothetical protein [Paenibacillus glucanolyticus]|nr:hypothetical protein [Paenibacillus glucanolyticus]
MGTELESGSMKEFLSEQSIEAFRPIIKALKESEERYRLLAD